MARDDTKNTPLSFDWVDGNRDKNWYKHQVSWEESEQVFSNSNVVFTDVRHSKKEERWVIYGITNEGRRLAVFFTYRKLLIRVISARDQNKKERKIYEEQQN